MHHKAKINSALNATLHEYADHSRGFTSQILVDGSAGAVHMRVLCNHLAAGGAIDPHIHSYEESFFVLEGNPILILDGRAIQLAPGSTGVIPLGREHSWRTVDEARWFETDSPLPRASQTTADTYFLGKRPDAAETGHLDVRDPRNRNFFQWTPDQNDTEKLQKGVRADANEASASMSTAVYAYTGIAVKVLVNERLDAETHTLLLVEFHDSAVLQPHDHPFEELYFVLEGETTIHVDEAEYVLGPGDVVWTGVGTIHKFENSSGARVRFLEPQAPQPPRQHAYRFARDWDYLESCIRGEPHHEVDTGSIH
ncbi:cupin domain-containing protein [Streptomyces sp. NPDC060205]|uniref:cupin domain-containing protein n=1 Tax=Streptomyces sp. NPDC060205 TaxID=3347072 RepID=UPI0036486B76